MASSVTVLLSAASVVENADLLALLAVGVLAGAHCLGMCGPLVTLYAGRMASDERRPDTITVREVRQHALFNLGRAVSYATVGALFGLLGAVTYRSADTVAVAGDGVRGVIGVAVGVVVILAGAGYLARGASGLPHLELPGGARATRRLADALTSRVDRAVDSPAVVALGAAHGLFPCPIIYPAYLYAFALGDPVRGGLSLAVLGVGTIPTLFAYSLALHSLSPGRRTQLHRALGVAFVALGYVPLAHGLALLGVHLPHPPLPHYQPL